MGDVFRSTVGALRYRVALDNEGRSATMKPLLALLRICKVYVNFTYTLYMSLVLSCCATAADYLVMDGDTVKMEKADSTWAGFRDWYDDYYWQLKPQDTTWVIDTLLCVVDTIVVDSGQPWVLGPWRDHDTVLIRPYLTRTINRKCDTLWRREVR